MVTGPRDTGKTRLIESVMRETEKNNRMWWLHINMRDPVHQWTSVETLYRSLLLTFTAAFYRYDMDAAKTFLKSLRVSVPLGPGMTTANLSVGLLQENVGNEGCIEEMLSAAEKVMNGMKQSLWSGQYHPVLSFDDAEKMYTYLGDEDYPEGNKVLEIVRNFLVNTNSHVIISSTNVHQFLKDMKQRLEIIMVGDLSREDAKEFWEEYLPANNPSTPVPSLHSVNFDDVYDVFGGHMFHLKQC